MDVKRPRLPRAILADDEAHLRMIMRLIVARIGFQVLAEANNGEEAVLRCRESRPDLVLLDVNMPGMRGDAALKAILAERPDVVAIMLTAESDSRVVSRCIQLGAANYVRKDLPPDEIAPRLRRTWNERNPGWPLESS